MHCHVEGVPTICMDCENRRAEEEEAQHQEEMRQLEEQAMEEHFARQPHG